MRHGLDQAAEVGSFEREGRTFRIWQFTDEGSVHAMALSAQGGSCAANPEAAHYRSGPDRPITLPGRILLRRETPRDRLLKRLGFDIEPQTGHPDFDDTIYVATTSPPDLVRALFRYPAAARAAVAALRTFDAVILGDPRVPLAGYRSSASEADLEKGANEARAAELDALAAALPALEGQASQPKGVRALLSGPALGWSMAMNVLAFLGFFGVHEAQPLDGAIIFPPLVVSLFVHVALVFTLGRWLARRTPVGRSILLGLFLMGPLQMGFAFVGVTNYLNQARDVSRPRTLATDVVSYRESDSDTNGSLILAERGSGRKYDIDSDLMPSKGCKSMALTIRDGWLKSRWIERVRCTHP